LFILARGPDEQVTLRAFAPPKRRAAAAQAGSPVRRTGNILLPIAAGPRRSLAQAERAAGAYSRFRPRGPKPRE